MDFEKYTDKSKQLIQAAQEMALMVAEQETLALPAPIPTAHIEYER